jgi:hypothetical protein
MPELFLLDLRLLPLLAAPVLREPLAEVFLAEAFELDLDDFFLADFPAGTSYLRLKKIHKKQRSPSIEEALPAVDDALAFPPGLFEKPATPRAARSLSCPGPCGS